MPVTYSIYVKKNSLIHNLHPLAKLTIAFTPMIIGLAVTRVFELLIVLVAIVLLLLCARVTWKSISGFVGTAAYLSVIFTIAWVVFSPGGKVLFDLRLFRVTEVGLSGAAMAVLRVFSMVLASALLLYVTSESQLLEALRAIRVPYAICFILMLAIRLIPTLNADLAVIREAQMSRGCEYEKGNLFKRLSKTVSALIPFLAISFRRVEILASALEARAFGVRGKTHRTSYVQHKMRVVDSLVVGVCAIVTVMILGRPLWHLILA